MTAMRNKRLAWALEQTGLLQWWARKEVERRRAEVEQRRQEAFHGPPMTEDERRQHGEAVAAVRRADEAKRQAG